MKISCAILPSIQLKATNHAGSLHMSDDRRFFDDPFAESNPWPIRIYTLGRFEVLCGNEPLRFPRKVPRRPLLLLKAVIAFGCRNVSEDRLIDALWPEADGAAARMSLTSAIHRLRRLLTHGESIIRRENRISLDQRYTWVDAWVAERLLEQSEQYGMMANFGAMARSVWTAADLYKGEFLSGESRAHWAKPFASRLSRHLLRQLYSVGRHVEAADRAEDAIRCYERCLRIDPSTEDACRRLMAVAGTQKFLGLIQ